MPPSNPRRRAAAPQSAARFAADRSVETRVSEAIRNLRRRGLNQDLQRHAYWVDDRELTPVQVDTLQTLVRKPVWRIKDLAAAIGVGPSQASRIVATLIAMGLAVGARSAGDRRNAEVSATEAGRRWADEIARRLAALTRSVVERLAPDRRQLLAELLEEYLEAVGQVRDALMREAELPRGD